jgi:AraC-like DNA-binding protein
MDMVQITFDDLVRLPVIQYYETAFRKVTGMSLKVVPPAESGQRLSFGESENPFCALVTRTPVGCDSCLEAERRAERNAGKNLIPQQVSCFAGLTDVAVPVVVDGRHVATLMSGQVFRRPPTERDFQMIIKMLKSEQNADWEKKTRKAYFETPVITPDRFQAMVHLLSVFAQYLADYASRHAISASADEPKPVASAKKFVLAHVEETITLALVAQHVHVSRFHFCKIFKKATGMTLTEYVARVRVEKAKTLLVDPTVRISEVVFAAGFGSIPRFNSVFKQCVGMPPTEYRATLQSSVPI